MAISQIYDMSARQVWVGRYDEHGSREVAWDVSPWTSKLGSDGVFALLVTRPRDTDSPYNAQVSFDASTNLVTWAVTDVDTALKGWGRAELHYYVDGALVKSQTFVTIIEKAMFAGSTAPSAAEGWVERMEQAALDAQAAAETAEDAETTATSAATTATSAAATATNAANSASSSASSARADATTATNAATAAALSESAASTSATNAAASAEAASTSALTASTAASTATTKASQASASASTAATAATTATTKASEATTAATTATTKAGEASTSASTATSAKDTAVSAASTATTKATEATTAAATAVSAKTDAVAANTAAQSAKTAAQTAQTGAETAAASVQSSAAQIATNAADISQLKSEFTANEKAFGTIDLVLSAEVMLGKYVDNTGAVTTSSSWDAYKCDLSKYVIRKVSAWTNNAAFYAIAFYASDDTFLGGVKFGTNSSAQAVEIDNIKTPDNASYAIISNRKATNPTVDIKGVYNGDYADIPTALDKISMESVIDCTDANYTLGNYYIASDGSITASGSWTAYVISASIKKLYAKTISNEAAFYTIGFYSDDSMSNASFITGIKFLNSNNFVENTVLYIPQNAKKIVICTRTATSTEQVVEATTLINYRVEQLETIVNDAGLTSYFGKSNIKAIYKNIRNANDFTIIKDEIWFAENVYVDGVATDTTNIHRYKIINGNLVKLSDMVTDFGHWNTVDYCEENDCLIFGNGANSTSTEGNYFSVIPHPLTLSGTVSIEDAGFKCPVDIGFKVQAVWGDNNFGKYDIAYVFANNATTICVIQLLKDANGDFTGEFRTLETLTSETSIGVGGADFWGDTLYIGDGGLYGLYKLSVTDLSAKRIVKKYYTESGSLYSGTTQGVHVDSDYLWVFSNVGGSSENYLIQYYR